MDLPALINIWTIGLPIPVALAVVALLGYFVSKTGLSPTMSCDQSRHDLKRARGIVRALERVDREVRGKLDQHLGVVRQFRRRIHALSRLSSRKPTWQELASDADALLGPTLQLATHLSQAYDEVRQQANLLMTFTEVRTDPLTGLCNRRGLEETLSRLFALLARYQSGFSVVMFDVDMFKSINDEQGHLYGDYVLQQVSRILGQCARETDTVARYGGEEFLAILPQTDAVGAANFADRTRAVIAAQLTVTVSGGVATALDGDNPTSLLARVDEALYQAKAAGRNAIFQHTGQRIEPVCEE